MKVAGWMVAGSVLAACTAIAFFGTQIQPEVWFGMAGPLAVAAGTWIATRQAYLSNPDHLTSVMVKAFAGKMVFFAIYVTAVVRGLGVRPIPFVISFTTYFIALYFVEAICLSRLFAGDANRAKQAR
jgi:uncharacterized membrane protein